jgi:hypothetical protein
VQYESMIEKQIREAQERGEFDGLPGAGKPIPGIDAPHDELWWVKDKLRRENVSYLPPSLALRKEVAEIADCVAGERTEGAVRRVVADLNDRIDSATRVPLDGPPVVLRRLDADEVVRAWRRRRAR